MRVENGHGKNKPNIRKLAENDMADGFNSDGLDFESGGQKKTVKVGTRSSKLALAQTELVIKALNERFPQVDFQMVTMSTRGGSGHQQSASGIRRQSGICRGVRGSYI